MAILSLSGIFSFAALSRVSMVRCLVMARVYYAHMASNISASTDNVTACSEVLPADSRYVILRHHRRPDSVALLASLTLAQRALCARCAMPMFARMRAASMSYARGAMPRLVDTRLHASLSSSTDAAAASPPRFDLFVTPDRKSLLIAIL